MATIGPERPRRIDQRDAKRHIGVLLFALVTIAIGLVTVACNEELAPSRLPIVEETGSAASTQPTTAIGNPAGDSHASSSEEGQRGPSTSVEIAEHDVAVPTVAPPEPIRDGDLAAPARDPCGIPGNICDADAGDSGSDKCGIPGNICGTVDSTEVPGSGEVGPGIEVTESDEFGDGAGSTRSDRRGDDDAPSSNSETATTTTPSSR